MLGIKLYLYIIAFKAFLPYFTVIMQFLKLWGKITNNILIISMWPGSPIEVFEAKREARNQIICAICHILRQLLTHSPIYYYNSVNLWNHQGSDLQIFSAHSQSQFKLFSSDSHMMSSIKAITVVLLSSAVQ